jgi:Tfp pilus assembly protein PilO
MSGSPHRTGSQPPWGIILQVAVLIAGLAATWGATQAENREQQREIDGLKSACAYQSEVQANLSWIRSVGEAADRRLSVLESERRNPARH